MPAGNAVEDDDYKKHEGQHVELLNDDPPLYISWKTMQQNKYLHVDKKHLVKKYYKLLNMMEGTKWNNLYQARFTSQCFSRCVSFWRIQEFITTFSSVASECLSLHKH